MKPLAIRMMPKRSWHAEVVGVVSEPRGDGTFVDIGMVAKIRATRSTQTPWKAYLGFGEGAKYLGAHYGRGGKVAAARAVQAAASSS